MDPDPLPHENERATSGRADVPPEHHRVRIGPRQVKPVVSLHDQAVAWMYRVGRLVAKLNDRHRMDPLPLLLREVSNTVWAAKRAAPKQLTKLSIDHPAMQLSMLLGQVSQSIGIEQLPVDRQSVDAWGIWSGEGQQAVISHLASFAWRYLPGGTPPDAILEDLYNPASIDTLAGTIASQLLNLLSTGAKRPASGIETIDATDQGVGDAAQNDRPEVPQE